MAKIVADLRSKVEVARQGGGAKAMQKHLARNKLLPRERVATLLDAGSPFLELSPLAGHELYDDDVPSGGVVTGACESVERVGRVRV